MTSIPHPSPGRHRPAPGLTRRGRIVRDLTAGAAVLSLAVFAQPISVAFFTAVLWAGQATGMTS